MRDSGKITQLIVILSGLLFLALGCSSTPGPATPQALPPNPLQQPLQHSEITERLNQQYLAWRGVPYKNGGSDKRGIDCSGFVHVAFKQALGIRLPRTTKLLSHTGIDISRRQLAAGDLVFFKTGFSKHHIGIYLGDGQFIHASTSRGVMKSSLKSPYWSKHYWKSTRVLNL